MSENLSEALRADGMGENLFEAPLLSLKKKENNKQNMVKLHAGSRCSMEKRKPFNSQPGVLIILSRNLTSTSSKSTHVFSRYVQFYQGLNLLQEDVVFLQEDAVFLQEGTVFLQEGADFLQESAEFL